MIFKIILVFIGGGIGAVCRYTFSLLGEYLLSFFTNKIYPVGTFSVNIIGSLIIGLLFGLFSQRVELNKNLELFLIVGILGGFTTFSSFSLDVFKMVLEGRYLLSGVYIVLSVVLALLFTFLGFKLSNSF